MNSGRRKDNIEESNDGNVSNVALGLSIKINLMCVDVLICLLIYLISFYLQFLPCHIPTLLSNLPKNARSP
jgi:hypothetical protein